MEAEQPDGRAERGSLCSDKNNRVVRHQSLLASARRRRRLYVLEWYCTGLCKRDQINIEQVDLLPIEATDMATPDRILFKGEKILPNLSSTVPVIKAATIDQPLCAVKVRVDEAPQSVQFHSQT
jgi:hypothetical protein